MQNKYKQHLDVGQRLRNTLTCESGVSVCVSVCSRECFVCHLGRQQSVGVEAFHVGDQVVLGVDDILDEHAVEKEPVGPAVHRDALWDFTVAQPPHVGVALEEETIQTLLTDKPGERTQIHGNDTDC